MPTKRINHIISELSLPKKILGAGSVFMILALFMPWYQDKDTFNTGVEFIGLNGPLFLVGFTLLVLSVLSIVFLVTDAANKKISFLPFKTSSFHLFAGLFAFYALLIVNSVYFHQSFGLNITFKQSRFGMFIAFIAASLMTIGGYLAVRDKGQLLKEFREETQEPLIKVPDVQEKPKESLKPVEPVQPEPVEQTQIVEPQPQTQPQPQRPVEQVQPQQPVPPQQVPDSNQETTPSQAWRTDL